MSKIGITTNVPVEVLFAAGAIPVDLNNIFVTDENLMKQVELAEMDGFPRSTCAWIKGIYSSIKRSDDINRVIGVIEGDCSNTKALIEVLQLKNIETIPFAYPHTREYNQLKREIKNLCNILNTTEDKAIAIKHRLDKIRKKVAYIDEMTWKEQKVTGFENHIWQVSCSDFNQNYEEFEKQIDSFIQDIEMRTQKKTSIRLGYVGVPPIYSDIYDFVEQFDAQIIYNEVQRQFTMADGIGNDNLTQVYIDYTYPYDLNGRLADIENQIKIRKIDGLIHYTQAFCYRGIEDIIMKEKLDIPILTIEGDRPGSLDARTKLRIEAFIDMLN